MDKKSTAVPVQRKLLHLEDLDWRGLCGQVLVGVFIMNRNNHRLLKNTWQLPLFFVLFSILMVPVVGQAQAQEWDNSPRVFGVNVLKPHATSMPYSTIEEAKAANRKASPWYQTLSGTWKFHWVNAPATRHATFFQDSFDPSGWSNIAVPGSWQLQGYDLPIYSNVVYPWAYRDNIQPPAAPKNYNPVGHYRRDFTVPAAWNGRRIRLHFEGVESAYYVWINGQYVGYSENSFTGHEFDITDKLRSGTNNISVQVFRWCDGSWLEDQDFIRLAGIFRDLYIYSTPKVHIQDFQIDASLASNYRDGDLNASVWVDNFTSTTASTHTVELRLFNDLGSEVGAVQTQTAASVPANGGEVKLSFRSAVSNVAQWSAEKPNLYTLVLALKNSTGAIVQTESAKIGFRKVELKRDAAGITRYYINNQPVKFRGANRHEIDPDHGRVLSLERMEQDILIMKQFNLNALRMSHYPNDPRMYELCDKHGIYVIDEANLETHGAWDVVPKNSDDWRAASVERMSSMIQRDKNHPSVVLWSLGNEAGNGNVFTSMRDYAHAADSTRPIHYEGDWSNADVNSWMYYTPTDVRNYNNNSKPIMLCEFEHAMGNSVGELKEYVDAFYANPRSFGGFIWDFVDQGLRRGATKFFNFGGLWGDRPNDDNFCANGIIFPDRTLQPEIWEVKHQYRNILVKDVNVAAGSISIESRFNFTTINEIVEAIWQIKQDGKVIQQGTIPSASLDIGPLASKNVTVPFTRPALQEGSEYHLDIDFRLKSNTSWASAGHSIAHEQLRIAFGAPLPPKIDISSLPSQTVTQTNGMVNITGSGFVIAFDKEKGIITNYTIEGTQIIKEGPIPNFWRAPTDNDRGNNMQTRCAKWQYAGRDRVISNSTVTIVSPSETRIDLAINLPNAGSSTMTMRYTFYGSGDVVVEYTLNPDATMAEIPNVGTLITIPGGFESLRWYGRGPYENYVGRNQGSFVGIYSGLVDSMTIPYMEIGETGQRTDVRWAALTNATGVGLLAVGSPLMEINAQHHTPQQLTDVKLPWELTRQSDITFRVDLKQMGLGGINSWGAKPLDPYLNFARNTHTHTFRLSPIKQKIEDPTLLAGLGFKNLPTTDQLVPYPTIPTVVDTQAAFVAATIPGIIQAENYDLGGEALAYHDVDMVNSGNTYRTDGVDITGDSITGYKVGWTVQDEWLEYTLHVNTAGIYNWEARVSSGGDGSSFLLLLDDAPISDTIAVPNTTSWDTYTTIQGATTSIPAGQRVLKVLVTGSYFNFDWINFTEQTVSINPTIKLSEMRLSGEFNVYSITGDLLGTLAINPSMSAQSQVEKLVKIPGIYLVKSPKSNETHRIDIQR